MSFGTTVNEIPVGACVTKTIGNNESILCTNIACHFHFFRWKMIKLYLFLRAAIYEIKTFALNSLQRFKFEINAY